MSIFKFDAGIKKALEMGTVVNVEVEGVGMVQARVIDKSKFNRIAMLALQLKGKGIEAVWCPYAELITGKGSKKHGDAIVKAARQVIAAFEQVEEDHAEDMAVPAPEKQAAPKNLSKTMQEAIDKMRAADWYYMHDGKSCEYFANETRYRPIGHEGTGIVEGGYVYTRISSSTLNGLGKRGLVEVAHDGKQWLDAVKVVGMELPERITKALQVKIVRTNLEHPEWKPSVFIGYAVNESAVQHLVGYFTSPYHTAEATVLGEVELTVWDFFKNK